MGREEHREDQVVTEAQQPWYQRLGIWAEDQWDRLVSRIARATPPPTEDDELLSESDLVLTPVEAAIREVEAQLAVATRRRDEVQRQLTTLREELTQLETIIEVSVYSGRRLAGKRAAVVEIKKEARA